MKPKKDSTKPAARKDKKQAPRAKPPRAPGEPLTSLGFGLAKRYMRWEDAR